MFFTNGGSSSLPRGWGAPIYNWKKSYLQFEKIKIEKGYVQIEKIKSKNGYVQMEKIKIKNGYLQMKVFQFHT